MSDKQIKLLEKYGYKVIIEFNMIVDEKNLTPVSYLTFNLNKKKFELNIVSVTLSGDDVIDNFINDLKNKSKLIMELNSIKNN